MHEVRTSRLLVAYDPRIPRHRSREFLVLSRQGGTVHLEMLRTGVPWEQGMLVGIGESVTADDLIAWMHAAGRSVRDPDALHADLEAYLTQLAPLAERNIVRLVPADGVPGFRLDLLAERPER